jgi:2'-5' RNA ligase
VHPDLTADDLTPGVRDHWWWRPGWRPGRHLYACYLTFEDAPALHALVAAYQRVLGGFPGLDLIPLRWLHLTMSPIGFDDEVPADHLAAVREAVGEATGGLAPVPLTFPRVLVRPEAVYLPVEPAEPVVELRDRVDRAIAGALGAGSGHDLPEHAKGFRPHVSLAYHNTDGAAAPIRDALSAIRVEPVTVEVTEVPILAFHRDHRMYEWTARTPIPIGAG